MNRLYLPLLPLLLLACDGGGGSSRFERLPAERTGVEFRNDLPEQPDINILNYLYYYNGGGVAVGDVDGNGYADLYFSANLGPNRLYLNHGDFRFEDVTEAAGVAGGAGWTSGVTMADVNGDGLLDIYVSGVDYGSSEGANILYINNGDGTFSDRTAEHGLSHTGYSTQALFVDYDGDGDLDMYLLNFSTHEERGDEIGMRATAPHPTAGDRLFRNDGGRFTDVTTEAGIYAGAEGYGLGVTASDLDLDGCIDIYVANDFEGDDQLYLNNCDGTFTQSIERATGHTSRFSMGVDVADVDNDGLPDIYVADMLPEREDILRSSATAEGLDVFELRMRAGYHPQYARNTLQLNRGGGRFSEIGYLAGVHATDWSWATLLADFDNDGWKDLLVTNGIVHRPNDLDYVDFVGQAAIQSSLAGGVTRENLSIRDRMPSVPIPNYLFRNRGDLTFENVAEEWGLGEAGFSSGAAYVDLDNDGALDLVINDVNGPAVIYRNRSRSMDGGRFLRVELRGPRGNHHGIGARVLIHHGGRLQMAEQVPTRGFQSSVDHRLHFGLGASAVVDSLTVTWPDGRVQRLTALPVDTVVRLDHTAATETLDAAGSTGPPPLLEDLSSALAAAQPHQENRFFDFSREPLIPHQVSREGPAVAAADVDGDGRDDLYLGGAKWQAGQLLLQRPDGSFSAAAVPAFQADSLYEDVAAVFLDANGDGHADLYVVSGGNEFWGDAEALRDRLYLNDGAGGFERAERALPDRFANDGAVAAGDFDGDGDPDLFIGGRVVAREYGRTPSSALLRNDGGRFVDVTDEIAPELRQVGMVTGATWLRGPEGPELAVVGEWMPVRLFRMRGGRLVEVSADAGLSGTEGLWSHISAVDLNGDGAEDLVLGNLGLNSYFRASPEAPLQMHVADFAGDGTVQQVLSRVNGGVRYPVLGRDELAVAIPWIRARYPTHAEFATASLEQVFGRQALGEAAVLEVRTLASAIALRQADGGFAVRALPSEAQFAPIRAVSALDANGDGVADLLIGGNFHGVTPLRGRYDASYGELLIGDGAGGFAVLPSAVSGVVIDGEVRGMSLLRGADGAWMVAAGRNDDRPVLLRLRGR